MPNSHAPVLTAPAAAGRSTTDGVRDTIDSIVVAFILAFVFRAFIAEAFIIPTGSMAPSLYGRHITHRCSNCRYTFAVGVNQDEDVLRKPVALHCPNCGHGDDRVGGGSHPTLSDSGDRILVLKWPYDIGLPWLGPQRWSVVVFKNPLDGKQNYIKRLVGMPGEVLEIIDGDVYAAAAGSVPKELLEKLMADPLVTPNRGLTAADRRTLNRLLKIRRKPDVEQASLWMLHYDHDYPPAQPPPDGPRWSSGGPPDRTGWDAGSPCVRFDGRDDDEHRLELGGRLIADGYAYNARMGGPDMRSQLRLVGDVRLAFVLEPGGQNGYVAMLLSKNADEFRATVLADGRVTLEHRAGTAPWRTLAQRKIDPFAPGRELPIEFINCDYRVSLRIDGRTVVASGDDDYKPDLDAMTHPEREDGERTPARVALAARGLPLAIRHLTVHRDVFYRSQPSEMDPTHMNPYLAARVPAWGTRGNPIYLRDDEYFMCGDNSPASKDSRLWWEAGDFVQRRGAAYQRGTVPADQLIGRAFFVYWPSGHRLGSRGLPVVPNVGRMRPIR